MLPLASTGLTSIYGDNGVGKSGYTRVLKKACRARDQSEPIRPNAYKHPVLAGAATAGFDALVDGKPAEYQWTDGKAAPVKLSSIAIFDSRCARAYVDNQGDFSYVPYGLDILEGLAKVCAWLKERVQQEQRAARPNVEPFAKLALSPTQAGLLAKGYRSPLWRALDPSPTSEQEVGDLLGQLDSLKGVLFRPSRWNPGVAVPAPIDEELVSLLASHGGLDALAATTLLARKAELIHSPELRDIALAVYRELQVPLLSTPPLSIHGPELFRFIDLTFKQWIYPDPGRRLQVVIFSDEVRKAVEDLDREEDPEA